MRKGILKKIVAAVVTTAVAFTSIAFPNMNAVAADEVYIVGVDGAWDFHALSSEDGTTYTGEVDFTTGGDISVILDNNWNAGEITSLNGDTSKVYTKDNRDNVYFLDSGYSAGTYTVAWNKETGDLTIALKSASTTTYTYEYYVTGADEFEAESWNNTDVATIANNGKMTSNGDGTWTYTAHTSADFDGSAGYTIKKLGTPDDGSDKTFTDVKWFENCNYSGAGVLTITYNVDAWTSEVTFVQDDLITIGAQSQANATEPTKYDLGFVTTISDVVIDNNKVEDIKEMGIIVINSGDADANQMVLANVTTDGAIRKITTDYVTNINVLDSSRSEANVYAFRSVIKGISDTAKEYTAVPYITYENGTTVYGSMLTRSVADTQATS